MVQHPFPAEAWSKGCLGGSGDPAKHFSACSKPVLGSLIPKAFPAPLVLTLFWNIRFRLLNHSDAFGCFEDIVRHQEELGF